MESNGLSISSAVNGDINEVKLVGRLDVKTAKEAEAAFVEAAGAARLPKNRRLSCLTFPSSITLQAPVCAR